MKKYYWNDKTFSWERVDRVQEYKGHKIESVTYHADSTHARNHRFYRVTFPSGRIGEFPINKCGGNIDSIKSYIDFNIKHNRTEYL